ncbi:hypothetical protein [Rhodovulum adriaticum]|uniref:Uncharacterized protein n=1 Tax=Rhodovulum adriaticum TaxID=35804 RepID=A0A4R2NVS0_RHOAD|nr:hypothetical protein [Rhodovulum adriaticum]MBK1634343.1 hypothetical protein [Rhodovulum adriaticum]TCP26052.1 hypothetical protein EV656_10213 [Rhodovulum adriaticum]
MTQPHLTPLDLPAPDKVLMSTLEDTRKDVQALHPLLDLLQNPETTEGSAAARLIKTILEMRDMQERQAHALQAVQDKLDALAPVPEDMAALRALLEGPAEID